uniref:Hyaluronidase n=1 Tax=Leptobrachium leishanense TaxID=445787 RepID=A0A8C5PH88_9ANUR
MAKASKKKKRPSFALFGLLRDVPQSGCRMTGLSEPMSLVSLAPLLFAAAVVGAEPILTGRPFVTVWNAPTARCWEKFGVALDLAAFDIVRNQNQSFRGSKIVIFYSSQLGYYPHYDLDEEPVNGGLPQNVSLKDHLEKGQLDIEATIHDPVFQGIAVVDWENWRPLWERNWDKMLVYTEKSKELVRQRHPEWPEDKILEAAKMEFEVGAWKFMSSTLELGYKMRPGGFWGFYGFPCCYNYDYKKSGENYTGECPQREVDRNNLLSWMWGASQALYPDIYLEKALKMSEYVGRYVKHRVEEGLRVAHLSPDVDLPVLPYARIVYTYSMDFLTQESCLAVKTYINETLGMYVVNVTTAAILCSNALCSGNGRCVRQDSSADTFLHLCPTSFSIEKNLYDQGFLVTGQSTKDDVKYMVAHFRCLCYAGWKGPSCAQKTNS